MISKKLQNIFLLSLALTYLHGLEEIITGFFHNDSFMQFGAQFFNSTPEAFYWISHLIWWLAVPLLFFLTKRHSLIFPLMILYGLVFAIELHHLAKAVIARSYYPGILTAFFYPILGFFYWKELLKKFTK